VTPDIARELNMRCQCVGTDVSRLRNRIDAEIERSDLLLDGRDGLFSPLPVFVSEQDRLAMRDTVRAVEFVAALPAYRQLIAPRSPNNMFDGAPLNSGMLGYDFHLTSTGPRLIEIKTNPGGALLGVQMLKTQQRCCDLVERYIGGEFDPDTVERQIVDMFLREWRQSRGGKPLQAIAIVDDAPERQYLYPEFLLFRRLFRRHGIDTVIVDPSELSIKARRLWAGIVPIDMVYNRLTDFYLESHSNAVLKEACTADLAVVTPHPNAHALFACKSNLAILTDAEMLRSLGVPNSVTDVLQRGIPRTLAVNAQDAEDWWSKRKEWFFKPVNGFGSKGSYRGDKITRSAFADVMRGEYVAQKIAPPAERVFDATALLKFDIRNFVCAGETVLSVARLYQGQTTNFRTRGGGFAPIYTPTAPCRNVETLASDCDASVC